MQFKVSVKRALLEKHNCCSNGCSHRLWKWECLGWCYVFVKQLIKLLTSFDDICQNRYTQVSPAELAAEVEVLDVRVQMCTDLGDTSSGHTPRKAQGLEEFLLVEAI